MYLAGCGASNTAALAFGGNVPADSVFTETWNGTNWTAVNTLNTGRQQLAGCGVNTAALAIGGNSPGPGVFRANVESWNGTNWTEVTDLNTCKR